jgi:hypothetical protein
VLLVSIAINRWWPEWKVMNLIPDAGPDEEAPETGRANWKDVDHARRRAHAEEGEDGVHGERRDLARDAEGAEVAIPIEGRLLEVLGEVCVGRQGGSLGLEHVGLWE